MNVLEFLKDMREDVPCEWVNLDRAIAELEEIMKPKTCEGCIYANDDLDECQIIDYTDEVCIRWSKKDYYEPKDQQ